MNTVIWQEKTCEFEVQWSQKNANDQFKKVHNFMINMAHYMN